MDEKIQKPDGIADRVLPFSSAKVLKREVYEASQEARDLIARAQEQAREIVEEAERKRDSIREAAEQEGRAQGLAEWNQILAQASQRADALAKGWEENMLRLSVRVAEKIIGEQLKLHPDTILDIVREVLKGARPGRRLAIQVNDIDAQQLRTRLDRLKEYTAISSEIEIVASASIPRGGCVIESELGIIDARLETQLKCLEDALIRGVSAD
jgi:type III secretion protein L